MGETKRLIDEFIHARSHGNPGHEHFAKAQLVMKGIDPDQYDEFSQDDPEVLVELRSMIAEFRKQLARGNK